jgi:hypothetical protein
MDAFPTASCDLGQSLVASVSSANQVPLFSKDTLTDNIRYGSSSHTGIPNPDNAHQKDATGATW